MRHRIGVLTLVTLLALAISACARRSAREDEAFSWTEQISPGSTLHIRDGFGGISVAAVSGTMAKVRGSTEWRRGRARDIQFQVTRSGNGSDVYVCAMWRASGRCDATGYRGKRTDTFLSFFSLFHRTTDATASFVVEVPAGVGIDAKTTNGAVVVNGVRAGVSARTVNGSVTAQDVAGRLNLVTTAGNVRFSVASLDGADTIRATTASGRVHGELPGNAEGTFDLSVGTGSVRSEFPILEARRTSRNGVIGRVGNAALFVKLRSGSGNVALVKSGASDSGTLLPR